MHYRCRYCDFEVDAGHMTHEIMQDIFAHERTHPENQIKDDS